MFDYIELGSTPGNEECAQVGSDNYHDMARKEVKAYKNQMIRILEENGFPRSDWPDGFSLVIKSNSHDFGTYYELAAKYNDESEQAIELAFKCEELVPAEWDAQAKSELGLGFEFGRSDELPKLASTKICPTCYGNINASSKQMNLPEDRCTCPPPKDWCKRCGEKLLENEDAICDKCIVSEMDERWADLPDWMERKAGYASLLKIADRFEKLLKK